MIAEYDGDGTILRTFVYGPGIDEPIRMYAYNLVIGDITGDGVVNMDDFLNLAQRWLLTNQDVGYDTLYDLNQDGKIDNADTDILASQWLKTAVPLQIFYYHFDGLGSVVALSDAAGNVVETYAYDVYGQSQPTGPATGNPYRFTARRWDPETNLYFYRSRYYNPTIGRFMQTDPIGYTDGINWYVYCGNNPIMLVDPWGLCRGYDPDSSLRYKAWNTVGTAASWIYNGLHVGMDVAGAAPVIGEPVDFIHGVALASESAFGTRKGAGLEAVLTLASMAPDDRPNLTYNYF